jgi:hypothetical protein
LINYGYYIVHERSLPLANEEIDKRVSDEPGNYLLGYVENLVFIVQYVGRSDTNLNERFKDWVGGKYKECNFCYGGFFKRM